MESLSDIEKELRSLSKSDEFSVQAKYVEHQPTVRGMPIFLYFAEIADRIEAAAKREKAEIEANALAVGGLVEAERQREVVSKTETTTVGNAAAHAMTLDEAIAHAEDVADRCDTLCGSEHRQLADWLKELRDVKRQPVGNAAAMREALKTLRKRFDNNVMAYQDRYLKFCGWHWHKKAAEAARWRDVFSELKDVCDAALSAPPRQCDVGTAEEQVERWHAFCDQFDVDCMGCPCDKAAGVSCTDCFARWAQMPYEAVEGARVNKYSGGRDK